MALATLKEVLKGSMEGHYGLGGFVTTDLCVTQSLIKAAEETGAPLILMIPWATTLDKYKPDEYLRLTVEMARYAAVPVVVHLDHGASFDECMKAIHADFTSVMYDGSSLPFEENIAITKKVVEAAHACGISVEAEIGHVGGAEGGALVEGGMEADSSCYTTVKEAVDFVEATGVDALAVAIGTVHGIYKGTPKLDLERLGSIRKALDIPLVLHGGSGLSDEDYRNVVKNGISKINYFTEASLTASAAAKKLILESGDKPLHMMEIAGVQAQAIEEHVKEKIEVFGWKK
jgi:fructose-bisphosphate aldolase class II